MPAHASQVEVQVPPGLEGMDFLGPMMAPGLSGLEGSHGLVHRPDMAAAISTEEQKEELIQEVLKAVRDHVDTTTTSAVEALWHKGQRAIQYMQQQHQSQTDLLQGQLALCVSSCRNLERENALLRTGLEALMKHLTMVFGAPQHLPPMNLPPPHLQPGSPESGRSSPFVPHMVAQASTPPAGQHREAPLTPASLPLAPPRAPRAASPRETPKPPVVRAEGERGEDFHTPAGTPRNAPLAAEDAPPGLPPPPHPTDLAASAPPAAPAAAAVASPTVYSFTITLRRADTIPLGLDVRGDTDGKCLMVEAVRPGGAVEAWNRLSIGDMRDIKGGDLIISINGVADADSMREECLNKHLLRMTVARCGPGPAAAPRGGAAMRAEADEFVPQVAPRDAAQ